MGLEPSRKSKGRSAKRLALIVGLLWAGGCAGPSHSPPDGLYVKTRQGTVHGALAGGIRTFKGIPYAAPPVGALRWKPPQPAARWAGVREATSFGPPCLAFDFAKAAQGVRTSGPGYDLFANIPAAAGASEDCLTLDVWAPANAKKAAVMVWLQALGAGSDPRWNPEAFVRDGIVFVTLNYRQLTMGNFAHPALTTQAKPGEPLGRFQVMDQMAALRWVKENIAAFGGDPANVTVFGESAGGASTVQLLTIPSAQGLFDKAIAQSANGWWAPLSLADMETVGAWMASQAGLPGKAATADQLRALAGDALPWLGVYSVDGRLQPDSATALIEAGRLADKPLMIGWTDFDGSSLRYAGQAVIDRAPASVRAAYASQGRSAQDLALEMYTDSHNGAPSRWIASKAEGGAPAFLYVFSYVRTSERATARGAAHGDEIPFVFDNWSKAFPQVALSAEDQVMARMMHACWVSFAKTGRPRCEGAPDWPRYSRRADQLMELRLPPRVVTGYRKAQLDAQEAARAATIAETRKSVDDWIAGMR